MYSIVKAVSVGTSDAAPPVSVFVTVNPPAGSAEAVFVMTRASGSGSPSTRKATSPPGVVGTGSPAAVQDTAPHSTPSISGRSPSRSSTVEPTGRYGDTAGAPMPAFNGSCDCRPSHHSTGNVVSAGTRSVASPLTAFSTEKRASSDTEFTSSRSATTPGRTSRKAEGFQVASAHA